MHATVRRYDGIAGAIDEVMHAGRRLAATLSAAPGFISFAILEAGDDAIVSISVFEHADELDAADRLVSAWVQEHLPASLICSPQVISGEVIVQRGM